MNLKPFGFQTDNSLCGAVVEFPALMQTFETRVSVRLPRIRSIHTDTYMHFCLCIYICMRTHTNTHSLSFFVFLSLSLSLSLSPSVRPSVRPSGLPACLPFCLSVCLSVCLFLPVCVTRTYRHLLRIKSPHPPQKSWHNPYVRQARHCMLPLKWLSTHIRLTALLSIEEILSTLCTLGKVIFELQRWARGGARSPAAPEPEILALPNPKHVNPTYIQHSKV